LEVEEYFESALVIGLMIAGMFLLQVCSILIPPPYGGYVGMTLYLVVSVGGIFFVNVAAQLAAAPHPYLKVIVRPDNKELHVFVDKDMSFDRHLGNGVHEAHFKTVYPVKYKDYGKIREIIVLHRGKLSDHVYFRPGTAVWKGIFVKHPAVETIEVAQASTATTTIDHGEPIPIFHLLMGSKDKVVNPTIVAANPGKLEETVRILQARVQELEMENAKLRRDAVEEKQRALALEEVVVQQRAETSGLLEAKTGIKEHAYETFLGLLNAFGRFDKAVEALGGRRWRFALTKWAALAIVGIAVIAYFWANPGAAQAAYIWLSNPVNFFLIIIGLVIVFAIIYYAGKRRR
jgi:hypothetical protein